MTFALRIIIGAWLVFMATWFVGWFFTKKGVVGRRWTVTWFQLALYAAFLIAAQFPGVRSILAGNWISAVFPAAAWIGALLAVAGIGLAIWARMFIGANWGQPMTLRVGHELVTSGPYRYVRHPIYSGVLLAMLGTAIASQLLWLAVFLMFAGFFTYSARMEERTMTEQFGDAYRTYKAQTRMLVPFIF
ncbi:MAG: isoprenylcysteine carboxylmethyltransferase family protein [Patescibacteria group bacterium]|nr:isoprenylcysteine carboxylmethyltransferase family protein [Patescibacteria group bacterium]